ncbi:4-(cytidine 5'-diphospho)-2-C-methyl-D-erythritol kinase [Pacificimonas pallii]|uniref:4-(cytidine 5'-diphospho)-2-C-methyl-D-erythritol kinase n=1 Tax=Pacificimonas pallii TaxID=2827236 RepID=UPI0034E1F7F7
MTADARWSETGFAKINLALHVRRRRDDGYHDIETLFAFCDDGDVLQAAPADAVTLSLTGPFAAGLDGGGDNLVLRAAQALKDASGYVGGAALTLDKRLPVASGIGGGSADAAATLRLLNRMWRLDWPAARLAELALPLGADIPACVHSHALRGEGIGEKLRRDPGMDALAGVPVLLVNPLIGVSTADVFRGWDRRDRGPLATGDALFVAASGRNDLMPPARAQVPEIAQVLETLGACAGTALVRMSGSGATCFALFEDKIWRDRAEAHICAAQDGWWTLATKLRAESGV